jgi:glucose/arabinose dehydrogenase
MKSLPSAARPARSITAGLVLAATLTAALSTAVPAVAREAERATVTPSGVSPFQLDEVLSGYTAPVYVTNSGAPNRLFIVEQGGRIKVASRENPSSPWVKVGTFLNITGLVETSGNEQGLLGLAFDPNYAANGRFYVFYTRSGDGRLVIDEYRRATMFRADPGSRRNVLGIRHDGPADNHNGGWIDFGPDGYLYIATGDGGAGQSANAQDRTSRLGKILRIDPHDPDGPGPRKNSVPADNPFVGASGHDQVWAYGLRNPWRNSHDSETGDLWIGDVGERAWEEIDRASGPAPGKGANYGWNLCEGDHRFQGTADDCGSGQTTTIRPVAEYASGGDPRCSVTGGYVYRGSDQPSIAGMYFFGDFCTGEIWAVPNDFNDPDGSSLPAPLDTALNVSSFGMDGREELYVVNLGGTIHQIVES